MGRPAECPADHQTLPQIPPRRWHWNWQNDIKSPDHEGRGGQHLLLWQGPTVPEALDGAAASCGRCQGVLCRATKL